MWITNLCLFCSAITPVGPNSILQVWILCDRIRSRNTKHPTLVSTVLPPPLLPVDSLFSLLSASTTSTASNLGVGQVWREMAARGDLTLQALGVDINRQVGREFPPITSTSFISSSSEHFKCPTIFTNQPWQRDPLR